MSSSASHTLLQATKKSLRVSMTKILMLIPPNELSAQSEAVIARLISHPYYQQSSSISIFVSMATAEIQTESLIHQAFKDSKIVYIPYCPPGKGRDMFMLRLRDGELEKMQLCKWGYKEFTKEEVKNREEALSEDGLEMIIVPGVAFDLLRNRLGHGKGYYDTYIDRCIDWAKSHSRDPPKTVALALNEQILPEGEYVPVGEWDIKPDIVCYPGGLLTA